MQINMKGYCLKSFDLKDLYTWDEIIETIEDLEAQVHALKEEIQNLKKEEEPDYDLYEDYKLGLLD